MSFKRRAPAGTPAAPALLHFSSGISSLDDVLGGGGGMPSGSVFLALTPDAHSSYGDLLHKYSIAQGLHSSQHVCLFGSQELVDGCMWLPKDAAAALDDVQDREEGEKMTIAWRYENVKRFQTTVDANLFDLSTRIPPERVQDALHTGQLRVVPPSSLEDCLDILRDELSRSDAPPLRISLPSLANYEWGDVGSATLLRFLHTLRGLLRASQRPSTATVTLPAHLSDATPNDPGWLDKLGWLTDACISFSAFSADPSMTALFPAYHGLVHIRALPAPHNFAPPSDKSSVLRGVAGGVGENNLAFKTTRKKFVLETMHLDLEGGVSERRTTPAPGGVGVGAAGATLDKPAVAIEPERERGQPNEKSKGEDVNSNAKKAETKAKKVKKVGFVSDRPDLYDF